jgi:hypothetical protein
VAEKRKPDRLVLSQQQPGLVDDRHVRAGAFVNPLLGVDSRRAFGDDGYGSAHGMAPNTLMSDAHAPMTPNTAAKIAQTIVHVNSVSVLSGM